MKRDDTSCAFLAADGLVWTSTGCITVDDVYCDTLYGMLTLLTGYNDIASIVDNTLRGVFEM